jgi:hypothetical protein
MTADQLHDTGADGPQFPGFRFPEAAALFNPALGAVIVNFAARGHLDDAGAGLPWLAAFLAVPLALHPPTRDSLPRDIRTSMASWAADHPVLRDGFNRRASALAQTTRDGLRFALRTGVLALDSARLVPTTEIQRPASTGELRSCVDAARLCGRWIARTDLVTAYQLLGVRP